MPKTKPVTTGSIRILLLSESIQDFRIQVSYGYRAPYYHIIPRMQPSSLVELKTYNIPNQELKSVVWTEGRQQQW